MTAGPWLIDKFALARLAQWTSTASGIDGSNAASCAYLTVLHTDKGFELIAEITGQPTERLVQTGRRSPDPSDATLAFGALAAGATYLVGSLIGVTVG